MNDNDITGQHAIFCHSVVPATRRDIYHAFPAKIRVFPFQLTPVSYSNFVVGIKERINS